MKKQVKDKNKLYTIVGFTVIVLLSVVIGKLVIYDGVIGQKIYDENNIVIRYHRFVNVVGVSNRSDDTIYMHYQSGKCRRDANRNKRKFDIKYYERSVDYEIEKSDKMIIYTSILDDGYIFTVSNGKDIYDSVSYNKHMWF